MRRIAFFYILILVIHFKADAQIPRKISNAFTLKFSTAENVNWTSDSLYTATFEHQSQMKKAIFNHSGKWLKTIIEIESHELPYCIKDFINQDYNVPTILNAEFIKMPEGNQYSVVINVEKASDAQDNKELKNVGLSFNEKCDFLDEKEL